MGENENYKVYVHINKINGKRYFGITKQEVEKRWLNGKGYSRNKYFNRAIEKYGWHEGFEHIIVAKGLSEDEAKWLEMELIREWNTTNPKCGYNYTLGGDSNPMDIKEVREKVSNANKGKKLSEEHKMKIGKIHKGKKHSEETRKKMSESHKEKWKEEKNKKIRVEAMKSKRARCVYIIELDKHFESIVDCAKYLHCTENSVWRVLNGTRKTIYGYHIIYVEDKDN